MDQLRSLLAIRHSPLPRDHPEARCRLSRHRRWPALTLFCIFSLLWNTFAVAEESLERQVIDSVVNGGFAVAGKDGPRHRENELFIPASAVKILTSLVALERLGADFRFQTDFFVDHRGHLYIRGSGDPGLTSEVVRGIAVTLFAKGLRKVRAIVFDTSAYAGVYRPPGAGLSSNPYDAPNGPLAVNFNTLPVMIDDNRIVGSGEAETPYLPMMSVAAPNLPPGRHRINVAHLPVTGPLPPPLQLAAELFAAMLEEAGVSLGTDHRLGATPEKLPLLHRHLSPLPLLETVRDCLQYSNNFMANQLFLTCGAQRFGPPATWEKGRRCFSEFFSETLQLDTGDLQIAEGSGLSRANRISAVAMLQSLERFRPFAGLLPKKGGVLRKSGTLSGVFCYAGYLPGPDGRAFAILLNQSENRREEVLAALLARETAQQ